MKWGGLQNPSDRPISEGTLDLAIINEPPGKLGLISHPLLDEEMVAVGGRDTPVPVGIPIAMRDLAQLPLILPSARHGLRIELDRRLAAEGVTLVPKLELDMLPGIADFVARTRSFTVLPSIAVSRQLVDGSLHAYRIVKPRIMRQLVVVHHPNKPMSAAATKLVEFLRRNSGPQPGCCASTSSRSLRAANNLPRNLKSAAIRSKAPRSEAPSSCCAPALAAHSVHGRTVVIGRE